MSSIARVLNAMIMYYSGNPKRISHFLKVYGFAKAIGENENIGLFDIEGGNGVTKTFFKTNLAEIF